MQTTRFIIKQSVVGVPRHLYRDGVLVTSDKVLMAKLKRLPASHAEEVVGNVQAVAVEAAPEVPVSVSSASPALGYDRMGWQDLRRLGWARGVYTMDMKRDQLIVALQNAEGR